jgi:hypothetical protein
VIVLTQEQHDPESRDIPAPRKRLRVDGDPLVIYDDRRKNDFELLVELVNEAARDDEDGAGETEP